MGQRRNLRPGTERSRFFIGRAGRRVLSALGPASKTVTAHTLRPAMLAHQIKAFGIVQQRREVDQFRYRHAGSLLAKAGIAGRSSDQMPSIAAMLPQRSPPRNPTRAIVRFGLRWGFGVNDGML